MINEVLKEKVEGFNRYITDNGKSVQEIYDAYAKFYNWLIKKYKDCSTDEETSLVLATLYDTVYSSIMWAMKCGLIFKEFAINWNWKLVKSVGEFVNQFKNISKEMGTYQIKEHYTKFAVLLNRILNEEDFATAAYCCQMLQLGKFVNFNKLSFNLKHPKNDEKMDVDQPFEKTNNYEKLYFLSKDNNALDKFVTIPMAIEKGLNLHLLQWTAESGHQPIYLNDFELERMGFEKPTEDHTPIWEVDESTLTETEKENLKKLDKVINEIMAPVTNVD